MDENQIIQSIIELFKNVQKRPGLYIGPMNEKSLWTIGCFISGVYSMCEVLGVRIERFNTPEREEILLEEGLIDDSNDNIYYTLSNSGLSTEEAFCKLLDIEIKLLKRIYKI